MKPPLPDDLQRLLNQLAVPARSAMQDAQLDHQVSKLYPAAKLPSVDLKGWIPKSYVDVHSLRGQAILAAPVPEPPKRRYPQFWILCLHFAAEFLNRKYKTDAYMRIVTRLAQCDNPGNTELAEHLNTSRSQLNRMLKRLHARRAVECQRVVLELQGEAGRYT